MFGTRASFLIDLFLAVQVLLIPAMVYAIWLVRRGNVRAHARVMKTCFGLFLLTVLAFEIDVHLMGARVAPAFWPLAIHLCFVLPTVVLWVRQLATARTATTNPGPHRRRGRLVMVLLLCTVATGIRLYLATYGAM